ncbi:UNVERIFIED_ORG: hypothetical protein J2Y81_003426 [Paraburkholderia sediminicola]|uniref:hypothetical protein n=1 Tax=Paraburkholderia TaxID=1822464 RepID=UPI002112BD04|nr:MULTISPECIES: hypothetical protein [Paraburkholderia]MCP2087409.1 hypothetical protein [Paraburkholderia sediminicola]MCX4143230.1 hypothetical protein [Paraburkholderia aspalathi]MDN7175903.1 hypothetical protein [Paraburkholderia sp. SEWSISQ10-3 4]MDQ6505544.1 hypothetical protein [Paraburkholderia aspalathi]
MHPQEKTLAQQLAAASSGQYTEAQIEDQMRIMGVSVNGAYEPGTASTLIGQMPTDSGARWMASPQTAGGQPVLTQITAQPNSQLQAYIMANYNSVAPGGVPSAMTYTPTPPQPQYGSQGISTGSSAGTICPNGNCGVSYGSIPTQQQMSDAAGTASAQLGVVSATAAAVAARTAAEPYIAEPAAAFSITTGAVSFMLGGVQQMLKPNVGQYLTEGVAIGYGTYVLGNAYPLLGPVITQLGNAAPDLVPAITSFEDKFNVFFNGTSDRK